MRVACKKPPGLTLAALKTRRSRAGNLWARQRRSAPELAAKPTLNGHTRDRNADYAQMAPTDWCAAQNPNPNPRLEPSIELPGSARAPGGGSKT